MTKEQAYRASKFLNIAGIPNTIESRSGTNEYMITFTVYSSEEMRQEIALTKDGFEVRSIEDGTIWVEETFPFGEYIDV